MMMTKFKALALVMFAPAALAQSTAGMAPDLSQTTPVASPNRTPAEGMGLRKMNNALLPDRSREALHLIDTQGRVVGRLEGVDRLIMRYNNEAITIQLSPVGGFLPLSGGLTWAVNGAVYYQSSDCSGQAFLPPALVGTHYIGVGLTEEGKNFVLVGDVRQAVTIHFGSVYSIGSKQCNAVPPPPATTVGVPVQASVNVDAIATPPFFVE